MAFFNFNGSQLSYQTFGNPSNPPSYCCMATMARSMILSGTLLIWSRIFM